MALLTPPRSPQSGESADAAARPVRTARSIRVRVGQFVTVLAGVLLYLDLVAPDRPSDVRTAMLLRIPLEALVGAGLLFALPSRARRVVAALLGALLGVLTLGKLLDIGFYETLLRPFNPVLDWALFGDAFGFLEGAIGHRGAILTAVAAALLGLALVLASTLSAVRIAGAVARHRTAATRLVVLLTAVWAVCALLSTQVVDGLPVASTSTTTLVQSRVEQVRSGIRDQQAFEKEAAVDAFRDKPGNQLLTGLRGKDFMLSFIESYGRSAVENRTILAEVGPALADDNRRLHAAGYTARSAFLTSPTTGGGSWLAHATLMSGLWINNAARYRSLVASDRYTLSEAFGRADWRTVGVMPGTTALWPEGKFYGYDQIYEAKHLAYKGPAFTLKTMPDQYTLAEFERTEHGKAGRGPLMAVIPLVSSHSPWAPVPRSLDWNKVGDGSVYTGMIGQLDSAKTVWAGGAERVRTSYGQSIAYSINSLISYVEKYGDDNLVLVFLGDHQPAPLVTGASPNRDVPITIVARDPKVLDRVAAWGWQDGLKPDSKAPVWRMSDFRDRFLTTFSN